MSLMNGLVLSAADREELAVRHLSMTKRFAYRYGGIIDAEEIESMALVSLREAARGYQPCKGLGFPYHAWRAMWQDLRIEYVRRRQDSRDLSATHFSLTPSEEERTWTQKDTSQNNPLDFLAAREFIELQMSYLNAQSKEIVFRVLRDAEPMNRVAVDLNLSFLRVHCIVSQFARAFHRTFPRIFSISRRMRPLSHTDRAKGKAVLTWNEVRQIRDRYSRGGINFARLAKEFRVSQSTVRRIVLNKIWKDDPLGIAA